MSRASRVNIKHMPLQLLGIIFSVQFPARHWPLPRAKCLSAYCYIYIQHFVWCININTILVILWIKEKFFNQRLFRLADKSILLQEIISAITLYFFISFFSPSGAQCLVQTWLDLSISIFKLLSQFSLSFLSTPWEYLVGQTDGP